MELLRPWRQLDKTCADRSYWYSQIRQGIANSTKGTAFVVYEDVMDAKQACDKLNGFNFQNRYLVGKASVLPDVDCSQRCLKTSLTLFADSIGQYYITNPKRWPSQKRTLPNVRKTWKS